MARKKKVVKAKEPIRLRFKELANGNKSIYLDIYRDGKRSYEFLKLYLIPEVDESSRLQNSNTLQAANAIKAQRVIELTNSEAGVIKSSSRSKMLLIDWMKSYSNDKLKNGQSESFHFIVNEAIRHLMAYKGESTTLKDVDKAFCVGFIKYLKTAKKRNGEVITESTAAIYFSCFNFAMNNAVKMGVITHNPIKNLSPKERLKLEPSKREYLTIDEVKILISSDCPNESVKKAFLFSCFCGMRISDIKAFKWGDVVKDGKQYRANIIMKKTKGLIALPLSEEAVKWMPEKDSKGNDDLVFTLPTLPSVNGALRKWAKDCGIERNITFHTARHTFATMLLTLGVDIYTTSKLLGHKDIKTTQIYAEIVDEKKDKAVNLANDVFGNL